MKKPFNNATKRILSLLAICAMLVGLRPLNIMADEADDAPTNPLEGPTAMTSAAALTINAIQSPNGTDILPSGSGLDVVLDDSFGESLSKIDLSIGEAQGWQGIQFKLPDEGESDWNKVSFDIYYKWRQETQASWNIDMGPFGIWPMPLEGGFFNITMMAGYAGQTAEEYLAAMEKSIDSPDIPAATGYGSQFSAELYGDDIVDQYSLGASEDLGYADEDALGFYGKKTVELYVPEGSSNSDLSVNLFATYNAAYSGGVWIGNFVFESGAEIPAEILKKPEPKTVASVEPSLVETADPAANEDAKKLLSYLKGVAESDYILYGVQNYPYEKGGASFRTSTRETSDAFDITGDDPAVLGIDTLSLIGHEGAWRNKVDLHNPAQVNDPANIPDFIHGSAITSIEAWEKGSITTVSFHMSDPGQVWDDYVAGNENSSTRLPIYTEGNEYPWNFYGYEYGNSTRTPVDPDDGRERSSHEPMLHIYNAINGSEDENDVGVLSVFDAYLQIVADYCLELQEAGVPVLLRPFHESSGDWFWWGPSGCETDISTHEYDPDIFIKNWQYIVEYFESKGVHNALYVYSPNGA
ncbi:MAG: glycoside hydrolase family 26 protein, partial [Clostridiales bacterium]|nr:glycoside hydrolase family 26 protein [Clostridiales bacterium]